MAYVALSTDYESSYTVCITPWMQRIGQAIEVMSGRGLKGDRFQAEGCFIQKKIVGVADLYRLYNHEFGRLQGSKPREERLWLRVRSS